VALTKVLAHRGAAQQSPENSLAAFIDARRQGADGVELDVRRSADGALVVAHDPVIEGLGLISELRVADLPPEVALLDAALEACASMFVNVEIKFDTGEGARAAEALAAQVLACSRELRPPEDLLFSSFNLEILASLRRLDAEVSIGWLLDYFQDPLAFIAPALEQGFAGLHPFVMNLDPEKVAKIQQAGLQVHAWTVDSEQDLEWLFAAGVDSVITDDVPLARVVQARRG
jgi:glycerophosphoryl diester phosphodiesterase